MNTVAGTHAESGPCRPFRTHFDKRCLCLVAHHHESDILQGTFVDSEVGLAEAERLARILVRYPTAPLNVDDNRDAWNPNYTAGDYPAYYMDDCRLYRAIGCDVQHVTTFSLEKELKRAISVLPATISRMLHKTSRNDYQSRDVTAAARTYAVMIHGVGKDIIRGLYEYSTEGLAEAKWLSNAFYYDSRVPFGVLANGKLNTPYGEVTESSKVFPAIYSTDGLQVKRCLSWDEGRPDDFGGDTYFHPECETEAVVTQADPA